MKKHFLSLFVLLMLLATNISSLYAMGVPSDSDTKDEQENIEHLLQKAIDLQPAHLKRLGIVDQERTATCFKNFINDVNNRSNDPNSLRSFLRDRIAFLSDEEAGTFAGAVCRAYDADDTQALANLLQKKTLSGWNRSALKTVLKSFHKLVTSEPLPSYVKKLPMIQLITEKIETHLQNEKHDNVLQMLFSRLTLDDLESLTEKQRAHLQGFIKTLILHGGLSIAQHNAAGKNTLDLMMSAHSVMLGDPDIQTGNLCGLGLLVSLHKIFKSFGRTICNAVLQKQREYEESKKGIESLEQPPIPALRELICGYLNLKDRKPEIDLLHQDRYQFLTREALEEVSAALEKQKHIKKSAVCKIS